MRQVTAGIFRELTKPAGNGRNFRILVELYNPSEINITEIDAPARAAGLFANDCIIWQGQKYLPHVTSLPSIKKFLGRTLNSAQVNFSNVNRVVSAFILNNRVEGMRMVIRLVSPDYPDEYDILFVGRCKRPGSVNNTSLSIEADQDLARLGEEIPTGTHSQICRVVHFGEGDCLGTQTLEQKTPAFKAALAPEGGGCPRTRTFCTSVGNEQFYKGISTVTVSGSYRYSEKVTKRFLYFFKKTKTVWHTAQYSSKQSESTDDPINEIFGRAQAEGVPIQWADKGTEIDFIQSFCEGPIWKFTENKVRNSAYTQTGNATFHLGEYGGVGSQQPDPRFPASGHFSNLAYIGDTVTGSALESEDDAPVYTAVVYGRLFPLPDADGVFSRTAWTDNNSYVIRGFLVHPNLGGINPAFINDESFIKAANKCDEIIADLSGSEVIYLPQSDYSGYGTDYRRFASTGVIAGDTYGFNNGSPDYDINGTDPYINWYDPQNVPATVTSIGILRRRYTLNLLLREKVQVLDALHRFLLPTCMGYIVTDAKGRLELRIEQAQPFSFTRDVVNAGDMRLPITNISPFLNNETSYLLVGAHTSASEMASVKSYEWAPSGNGVPLSITTTGSLTGALSSPTMTGGSATSPAQAIISFTGTPAAGNTVTLLIDGFKVSYTCHADDTLVSVAQSVAAWINGHPNLRYYILADTQPGQSNVRLINLNGYAVLNKPLKYSHEIGEENIVVSAVYETCGDLGLDNILKDTFTWNNDRGEGYNTVTALYTNAAQDFSREKIIRKAREHIRWTGKTVEYDMELGGVDNYHQAARLVKSKLIELRDCDVTFAWTSLGSAILLEEGDVVAVQHSSIGGDIRYTPVRITSVEIAADLSAKITARLYLTAQYLDEVAKTENQIQSTLTTDTNIGDNAPPAPTTGIGAGSGGSGGYTAGDNPYKTGSPTDLGGIGYSPYGNDYV